MLTKNNSTGRPGENVLIIRDVRITDPETDVDEQGDLVIADGVVRGVGTDGAADELLQAGRCDVTMVDGEGLWAWPGLVDPHVHFREPGFTNKETFETGGRAAMRGGYTSVICEPNTDPPLADRGVIREVADRAEQAAPVKMYFKGAMTAGRGGTELSDIEQLAREPAVVALSDDGDPVVSADLMREICRRAARVGLPLSPHCEDSDRALAAYRSGVDSGFVPDRPYWNETHYVERDCTLAARYGTTVHFSHLSLPASVEATRRPEGHFTCEVTPHHLLLSSDMYDEGECPVVNPPLRRENDRQGLCKALAEDRIDVIASDHAPHTNADKQEGASGFVGLETTLALVLTHFVHPGYMEASEAVRLLSSRPARIFGLDAGNLETGEPADVAIIDPDQEWTVRGHRMASRSRNTPFENAGLRGRTAGVIIDGGLEWASETLESRIQTRSNG
ncbi:MAG: dihydroorotase [Candidatus Brocadiia bacterium]